MFNFAEKFEINIGADTTILITPGGGDSLSEAKAGLKKLQDSLHDYPEFFWPDGKHPNRHALKLLYDYIVKELNAGCELDKAKEIIEAQGHSGMSFGLVCSMVKSFCNRGSEFVAYVR